MELITQTITETKPPVESQYAIVISVREQPAALLQVSLSASDRVGVWVSPREALRERPEWKELEFREAYLEASIEQGLAWQIRANREGRGMTQKELGKAIGSTQTGIRRFEDPAYGKHSLGTLVKLAHAFDCALSVRFVPYSQLAIESQDLSPETLYAPSYEAEAAAL